MSPTDLLDCSCRKPYWDAERDAAVIPIELPLAAEAPEGYVVVSDRLSTYHRPYRYQARWKNSFKPSPHCSFSGFQQREFALILEAEAHANGYKQCRRCWWKDFPQCSHCGRYI